MINRDHPKAKDLSDAETITINYLHQVRDYIQQAAAEDVEIASTLYPLWLLNEQTLQKLWGFEQNDNYIKWWNYPHCACPKMDNDDAYPTGYYIYTFGCPIHGSKT